MCSTVERDSLFFFISFFFSVFDKICLQCFALVELEVNIRLRTLANRSQHFLDLGRRRVRAVRTPDLTWFKRCSDN